MSTFIIVPNNGATSIPSENGKLIGWAVIKGFRKPYKMRRPIAEPQTA
jgi:hypothetical protein